MSTDVKARSSRPKKPGTFHAPLPWLRLWTEFATDPKVQMLSEVLQRRFVMLLCLTGSRLVPTADDAAVAFALRISTDEAAETKRVLCAAALIRDDWMPVAWRRRQFKSDHSGAERKRQQRTRDRERDRHGQVTAASRDSPGLEGEGEGEREEDQIQKGSAAPVDISRPEHGDHARGIFSAKTLPPKTRIPRNGRSNGPYEAINDAVEKLINGGACPASDVAGLAKCAHVSERQVEIAIKQLRDRGRLQ